MGYKYILFLYYQYIFCTQAKRIGEDLKNEMKKPNSFAKVYGNPSIFTKEIKLKNPNKLHEYFHGSMVNNGNITPECEPLDLSSKSAFFRSFKTNMINYHNNYNIKKGEITDNLLFNYLNQTSSLCMPRSVSYTTDYACFPKYYAEVSDLKDSKQIIYNLRSLLPQNTNSTVESWRDESPQDNLFSTITQKANDNQDTDGSNITNKDISRKKPMYSPFPIKKPFLITNSTYNYGILELQGSRKRVFEDRDEAPYPYKKYFENSKKEMKVILSNTSTHQKDIYQNIGEQPIQKSIENTKRKDIRKKFIKFPMLFIKIEIIQNKDFRGAYEPVMPKKMSFNTMNYYTNSHYTGFKMKSTLNYTYFKNKYNTNFWLNRLDFSREDSKRPNIFTKKKECCEVIQSSRTYNVFLYAKIHSLRAESFNTEIKSETIKFSLEHLNTVPKIAQKNCKCFYQFKVKKMEKIVANFDNLELLKRQNSSENMPICEFASVTNQNFDKKTSKTVSIGSIYSTKTVEKMETHPYVFLSYFMLNTPEFTAHNELFNIKYSLKDDDLIAFFNTNFSHQIIFQLDFKQKSLDKKIKNFYKNRNSQITSYQILNKNRLLETNKMRILELRKTPLGSNDSDFSETDTTKIYQDFSELKDQIEAYIFQKKFYNAQNTNECMNNLFLFIPELLFYIHLKQVKLTESSSVVSNATKYDITEIQLVKIILKNYKKHCQTFKKSNESLDNLLMSIYNFRKHINHEKNFTLSESQKYLYDFAFVMKYSTDKVHYTDSRVKISFLVFILAFTNKYPDMYYGFKKLFMHRYYSHKWGVQFYLKTLQIYPEISRGFALTLHLVLEYLKINIETDIDKTYSTSIIFPLGCHNLIVSKCNLCEKIIWTHSHSSDVYNFFFDQFLKLTT